MAAIAFHSSSPPAGRPTRPRAVWLLPLAVLCLAYGLLGLTLSEPLTHNEIMQRCVLVDPRRSRLWSVGNIEVGLAYLGVFGGMLFFFLRAYAHNSQHLRDLGLALAYILGSFTLDYTCVQILHPFAALLIGDAVVITFTALVSRQLWFQRLLGVFVPLVFLTCGIGHFLEGLSYWHLTYPVNVPWTMVTADVGFAILLNGGRFPAFIRGEDIIEELAAERARAEALQEQINARLAAEEARWEGERLLHLALESGRLGPWELDLTAGELKNVTTMHKALYGFGPEAAFTAADRDRAVHPEDLEKLRECLDEALRTGRTAAVDFRVLWPDGSEHWLRAHGQTVADDEGQPTRLIGATQEITAQKAAETSMREAAERQKSLLRDVLLSVTEGRLHLVETESDLPAPLPEAAEPILLTATGGLRELRQQIKKVAVLHGFPDERWQDLMTAASEGGMNTITHGGGEGEARVSTSESGTVQVRVRDWGAGINMQDLPKATLARGWSSTTSLGHGLVMMLLSVDRLWLLTGPNGTTVVMEKDRREPLPAWL